MNIFHDVGGPSLFSKVHQAMNLTLLVKNKSCTIYGVLANCEGPKIAHPAHPPLTPLSKHHCGSSYLFVVMQWKESRKKVYMSKAYLLTMKNDGHVIIPEVNVGYNNLTRKKSCFS